MLAVPAGFRHICHFALRERTGSCVIWLRRILLELWAVFALSAVVGFMGPFGTYVQSTLSYRIATWWFVFIGAYVLIRPCILLMSIVARAVKLPAGLVVLSGVVMLSGPFSIVLRAVGPEKWWRIQSHGAVFPPSLLAVLTVFFAVRWARSAEAGLAWHNRSNLKQLEPQHIDDMAHLPVATDDEEIPKPMLRARLSPGFRGPIVALEGEDHYVRVHGRTDQELVLIRLREAIAEMGTVAGQQVHRSWWVARDEIERVERSGRSWTIHLVNGATAPVSRDAVARLRAAGFLSTEREGGDAAPV